jgi:LysM repeat protein
MGIKYRIVTILILVFATSAWAQSQIEHTIVKGNTVYSIAKEYGSTIESIYDANPDLMTRSLVIGEVLIVPIPIKEKVDSSLYTYHKVRSFESIYSISNKYQLKDSTIYWHNPVLQNSPLVKKDQIIRIPKDAKAWIPKSQITQTLQPNENPRYEVYHIVFGDSPESLKDAWGIPSMDEFYRLNPETRNTWYVGQPLVRPLNQAGILRLQPSAERKLPATVSKDSTLQVVGLLPFFYRDYVLEQPMGKRSEVAMSFRQGMELAAAEFRAKGGSLELTFEDTQNNKDTLAALLISKEVEEANLIIGPVYGKRVLELSKFQDIGNVVSPMSKLETINTLGLWNTPVAPDFQYKAIRTYLKDHMKPMDKILLVGLNSAESKARLAAFVNDFGEASILAVLNGEKWQENESLARKDSSTMYHLVFLIEDPAFILDGLRNLRAGRARYWWYATENQAFAQGMVSTTFSRERKVIVATSEYADYNQVAMSDFVRKYRSTFGAQPDVYAMKGYDILKFHLNRLTVGTANYRGVVLGFDYEEGAHQNRFVELRKFEDLQWKPIILD